MSQKELFPVPPSRWETISWRETPYKGVFLSKIEEEFYPKTKIPKCTVMALKIDPNCLIPRHIHKRESNWQETITLPEGGNFEILDRGGSKKVSTKHQFSKTVRAREVFGISNLDATPLYFYSRMEPGFTGYDEIEEIKAK